MCVEGDEEQVGRNTRDGHDGRARFGAPRQTDLGGTRLSNLKRSEFPQQRPERGDSGRPGPGAGRRGSDRVRAKGEVRGGRERGMGVGGTCTPSHVSTPTCGASTYACKRKRVTPDRGTLPVCSQAL